MWGFRGTVATDRFPPSLWTHTYDTSPNKHLFLSTNAPRANDCSRRLSQSTLLLNTFFSLLLSFPRPHYNLFINFLFPIFLKTQTGTYPHRCSFHGHADMTKADRSSLTFLHSPSRRTRSECQIIHIPTCQLSRVHRVPILKAGSLMPRPL